MAENIITRRMLFKQGLADTAALILPAWALGAYDNWQRIHTQPVAPESTQVPNLGLKLDQTAGERIITGSSKWEYLPESSDRKNLSCPSWSPSICMGYIGPGFKIAVNRPMAEFVFKQSHLSDPVLKTNIVFFDTWPDELNVGDQHTGGFTAPASDMSEQITVIYLRPLAWSAFKDMEAKGLDVPSYINGSLSYFASAWLTHELGHAGAESKQAIEQGKINPNFPFDKTHAQIYDFQGQYTRFYNDALKKNLGQKALIVGVESIVDPMRLKNQIYQEAALRGLK